MTHRFIAELYSVKIVHPFLNRFSCFNSIINVITSSIETWKSSMSGRKSISKANKPMTTVPGYAFARLMNEGPNVKFAGPEKVFSDPGYRTYADNDGS